MENSDYFYLIIVGILHRIIDIAIIIACIILVIKQKSSATILMLIGSILTLFFAVGNIFWTQIAARKGAEALVQSNKITSILGVLPYLLFATGFILFVVRHVKNKRMDL